MYQKQTVLRRPDLQQKSSPRGQTGSPLVQAFSLPASATPAALIQNKQMGHNTAQPLRRAVLARYAAQAGNRAASLMLQTNEEEQNLDDKVESLLAELLRRRGGTT